MVFASEIKELSSLYFDVSAEKKQKTKKIRFFWRHFKLWLFTRQPFHLDVSETNNFLSVFSGSVDEILPLSKHPKGAKTTADFLDKCQLRCSTYK